MVRLHNALPMADDKAALSLPISFNAAIWYIVDVHTSKASSHKDSAIRDFPIKHSQPAFSTQLPYLLMPLLTLPKALKAEVLESRI